ncbi:hypothetical protein MES5069_80042 [Mesorhizobium escarrei]|uniref:Uncharacterized protein n=1 Tax=Mesorhizobium escarrei TaxID=666018 RepID=A0ABM9EIT5_9HYPH|nr:hypothetical protein MES5069_80042 [Mesorhizobium escarrei]
MELLFHIAGATLPLARVTQTMCYQDNKANGRFEWAKPWTRNMRRSTSSPLAAPRSTSMANRSARVWRISPPLPSRSAAVRPTFRSARPGSACARRCSPASATSRWAASSASS